MLGDCILKSHMVLRRIKGEKPKDFSFVFLQSISKVTIFFERVIALVLGQPLKVYRF